MEPAEGANGRRGARRAAAPAVVLFLTFFVSFVPIQDSNDAWWHLKAGKLLWDGDIGWYSNDPFTLSASEKVWVNHEWLAELLFHAGFLLGGFHGAILIKSLILLAAFGFVFSSCLAGAGKPGTERAGPFAAGLAGCLAAVTSQFTMYLRPPIWTFLLLAIYHWAFLRGEGKAPSGRVNLVLAGSMVLWANLHGGAILGCVVVGSMFAGSLLDWAVSLRSGDSATFKTEVGKWGATTLAVGASSLVNPYGFHLHSLTFEVMGYKDVTRRIIELEPPPFDLIWTIPLLLVPAVAGIRRRAGRGELLVFLFLAWQGLSHVRHLPLLAIWSAPYAASAFARWEREVSWKEILGGIAVFFLFVGMSLVHTAPPSPWMSAIGRLATAAVLCAGLAVALFVVGRRAGVRVGVPLCALAMGFVVAYPGGRPERFVRAWTGPGWAGRNYPDRIADFILDHNLRAPVLLNRETFSGYLIWRLSPETMKTFTCSRFDLQGPTPVKELETMLWTYEDERVDPDTGLSIPGWRTLWDRYRFEIVLIEKISDRASRTNFPLWDYLDAPDSGYVRVAVEPKSPQERPGQQFGLFVRKGERLDELRKRLGRPAVLEERVP